MATPVGTPTAWSGRRLQGWRSGPIQASGKEEKKWLEAPGKVLFFKNDGKRAPPPEVRGRSI